MNNAIASQATNAHCPFAPEFKNHSPESIQKNQGSKFQLDKTLKKNTFITKFKKIFHAVNLALHQSLGRFWIVPFITGPIYPFAVPHLRSKKLFGFAQVNENTSKKLEILANKKNGLATFWMGIYPAFYVTKNAMRSVIVRESHVGHIDDISVEQTRKWMNNNQVMLAFPVFQNIHSSIYSSQRKFLLNQYTMHATSHLSKIAEVAENFLQNRRGTASNLKQFTYELVLRTSSILLDLHDWPLDNLLADLTKTSAIQRVAHYLITENGDAIFENQLYEIFCEILNKNFKSISSCAPENNLIQNIFHSRGVAFPARFELFNLVDQETRHIIAMNFMATAIGGMVHSTSNSLDWAIARLVNDPKTKAALAFALTSNQPLSIADAKNYEKSAPLGPICEWILENVFINPTFSHELYYTRNSQSVTLPNGTKIQIPSKSIIIVNYKACNMNEEELNRNFKGSLASSATTGRFIHNPQNASFGGSRITQDSPKSRICPGAKVSLYEQMVLLSSILKSFELSKVGSVSVEVDTQCFPLRERVSTGSIAFS